MPVESATYIDDLNASNPAHTDELNVADSHMRLIKNVLKTTFPNIDDAVTGTPAQLNSSAAGTNIADGAVTPAKMSSVEDFMAALIPAGVMLPYAGSSAPTGFLLCYGQEVSRATYPSLFTAIGTSHGAGDGSTTFNLPDYRGITFAGLDNMGGVAASNIPSLDTLGELVGSATHTLTQAETPLVSHGHSGSMTGSGSTGYNTQSLDHNHSDTYAYASGAQKPAGSGSTPFDTSGSTTTGGANFTSNGVGGSHGHHTHSVSVTGSITADANSWDGNSAHNIVQPTRGANVIIKAH